MENYLSNYKHSLANLVEFIHEPYNPRIDINDDPEAFLCPSSLTDSELEALSELVLTRIVARNIWIGNPDSLDSQAAVRTMAKLMLENNGYEMVTPASRKLMLNFLEDVVPDVATAVASEIIKEHKLICREQLADLDVGSFIANISRQHGSLYRDV